MLKKDDTSFEKEGRFRSGKHKQRCFNMIVAGGTQRTGQQGKKKKQLTIQYEPFKWSLGVLKGVLEPGCRRDPTDIMGFLFLLYLTSF